MQLVSAPPETVDKRSVPKVLVVDDDFGLVAALSALLTGEGYEVTTALSAEEALDRLRDDSFHLVLCDLQLPGRNGIAFIRAVHEACPSTASVLITGHGSIRSAVIALKRGACEYMTKPIKPKRLLTLCAALTAELPSYLPNKLLSPERADVVRTGGMVARSRSMRGVFERIRLAASTDTTVLIVGESGTGKELVARCVHGLSSRGEGPFVPLHTGAIPQELIASELFGHEKGSFTGAVERNPGKFELAEGGTLFLDEVSTMDERTQIGLLRVLESFRFTRVGGRKERPADVRVVAASNRDLSSMVASGEFREDLYYRLNVFSIRLPSLRERPEDIPLIAAEFLAELAQKYRKPIATIPPETEKLLTSYPWPGNVRELRNVMEQAVLLARGSELSPQLLPQMMHREPTRAETITISIGTPIEDVEREVILRTLEAHRGNKTAAAETLGISRRSIYNKLAVYQQSGVEEDKSHAGPHH
ncbi:MAG: sigma-54-dependent Fis family transcriptional regulator [Deltaproteobacteria bacterium]|nr:sigma-54-dependent Fis family transcriptional regulator [Deltaproteobacteria bacterium]